MGFTAPVSEFKFIFDHVIGYEAIAATDRFDHADRATAMAALTEAGRVATEVFAPLQRSGDETPARLENGIVRTSPGFAAGYHALAEGGWVAPSAPMDYDGMGLPITLTSAVNDMLSAACISLQLNPLMTQGQIDALEAHASDEIKALYLPKLIRGDWTGTMNLTEPQAGSDVGALRTKAEPKGDGTYAITGQKIYISWGDTDFARNVCHLVLARLPGGVPGTKGISLFLVPKYLPDDKGQPGVANQLKVVSLEEKMGLHGSPTAVMQYEGATGWLVGEEHNGMAAMFTMMNNARLGVGIQGIGVAEGATQHAMAYALDRVQGRAEGRGTIIEHADVRRMLSTMKAEVFAARAIALSCAKATDMAGATGDATWKARAALLTPIAKAYGTEVGCRVSELGVQVHGGMGVIEETGAAQFYRDVRVTAIYEGTNGIQAIDLVGRKMKDGGEAAHRLLDEVEEAAEAARAAEPELAQAVWDAAETLRETTEWLVAQPMAERLAGATPYLMALARVLGAAFHLRAAAHGAPRRALAAFYIDRLLPEHQALVAHAKAGSDGLYALTAEELAA